MTESHQFLSEEFFIPTWKVKYLFLGTFNPAGGEKVNYFYGRESNYTWKILSEIFETNFNPYLKSDLDIFINFLKSKGIACMDIIREVSFDENNYDSRKVQGQGYKDSNIINKKVARIYNTSAIIAIIKANPAIRVFSTWGNGSDFKEWQIEIGKINNVINLKSPSRAARVPKGVVKFNYILQDWKSKISTSN